MAHLLLYLHYNTGDERIMTLTIDKSVTAVLRVISAPTDATPGQHHRKHNNLALKPESIK